MSGTTRRILVALLGLLLAPLAGTVSPAAQKMVEPPPNAPATVEWNAEKGRLSVRYQGTVLLIAAVGAENSQARAVPDAEIRLDPVDTTGEKVEQRLRFVLAKPQESVTLVLRGTVTGSEEAFPAETLGEAQKRFPLVRTSVGLSHSRRNNAVYDRRWDWVLSGPGDGATWILPRAAVKERTYFAWESRGTAIELVFRPRFYQKHRGLAYFEPWTYRVWKGSVTGYCTWWAYKHAFSQETLDAIVDVFSAKKLPDFGYKYIQLDDAYQIGNGSCPQNWLTWNPKFPGGAEYALRKIRSAGMEGGIWVHRVHRPSDPHVADLGKQHPDWFVKKPDGSLFTAHGFYVLDTKNREALDGMVRPIYRGHKEQGWRYVKIDGAGDLLSAYKNRECADHFRRINSTPEQSLRDWDRVAREVLGPDVYILNCWGVGPGLSVVGLADGCRLSSDGFQPETLANHVSYEGVVWRNDPDHCDILGSWLMDENAKMRVFGRQDPVKVLTVVRPAICSIAGGVLMTSDKVEVYQDDQNLEGMKRSAPVLPTVPGQLYDPGHGSATWWLQEIERPFEHWSVLSRIQWAKKREKEWKFDLKGLPPQEVRFADLGLPSDREYLVFEFWTQTFLGKFKDSFTAPAMDEHSGMQVFAIRQARPHPWLLSTTRHLSQGGVDLLDERWDAKAQTLSGKSAVVAGDPYVLTVHLPQGHQLKNVQFSGERVEMANQAETATVRIVPSATKTVEWKMDFALGLGPAPAAASKPNIILCMTDDQGWGDVSYNGHPELKTPELDKMAAAGIRFDRFYSAHPMCSPTRASCLTGRSPTRYVCMTWGHDLPLREVTIAEAVRTAGYVTGHFGKWHLGGIEHAAGGTGRGLPESFDAQPRHPGNQGFDEWWSAGNNYDIGYEFIYHNGKQVSPRAGDTSNVLMDVALEWIGKQAAARKPFLAVIWFPSPHAPHIATRECAAPYAKQGTKKMDYYGELAGVDHAMGRLRQALRDLNIADDTMLWFCSDNGAASPGSTGGLPGGKKWLTEGGTRVPGLLEWPARIPKPFATAVPACTMDFYPTVLDLLGIAMPDQAEPIDGLSLLPLIDGKMKSRPKPIPLVSGMNVRLVDNEFRFQNSRLFRFDEEKKQDVDVTEEMPDVHKRLAGVRDEFLASVKQDQTAYTFKRLGQ